MSKVREKLELHCDIISGYAFKSTDWKAYGIPVVKIGNISNGRDVILDEQTQYVADDFYNLLDEKYHVVKGDVLISLTGSHINQPNSMVGRCCRNYSGNKFLLNQRAGKVIPLDNTDKGYLYYLLSTNAVKYDIANRAYGGANQVNVSPKDIKNIKWRFPGIQKQKRIADVLSAYDDLIENNNKRIALLEKAAQELYKEWFVRFRFPGHEKAKFINGLPEGWERKKMSEYYNTSSGGTPSRTNEQFYTNGIYPWIKTGEVKDTIIINTGEYITDEAIKHSSAKLIPPRSVIMAMYGVNIGMLGYVDTEMTCNQACCIFADKREFSTKHYLYQYLKSIREYLLLISFGAAQQNVSQDLIKKIKIVMPTDDIIVEYEKKIDTIYNSIRSLMYKNQNLIKQRDLLLPRLMSGKLEV